MKFYFVKPKDDISPSCRWFVDEVGLQYVENHYRNYPNKKGGGTIDRWDEFEYKLRNPVLIDFGGMCWLAEPEVKISCDDTDFEMKVSHLPYFVNALKAETCIKKTTDTWNCGIWMFNHVYSNETRSIILYKAEELLKNCEEMLEGVKRHWDKTIEDINKDGVKIIRAQDFLPPT
jgi:hypothetical protein